MALQGEAAYWRRLTHEARDAAAASAAETQRTGALRDATKRRLDERRKLAADETVLDAKDELERQTALLDAARRLLRRVQSKVKSLELELAHFEPSDLVQMAKLSEEDLKISVARQYTAPMAAKRKQLEELERIKREELDKTKRGAAPLTEEQCKRLGERLHDAHAKKKQEELGKLKAELDAPRNRPPPAKAEPSEVMPTETPAEAPLALPTAAVASVAPAAEGKLKAEQDAPQNKARTAKAKPSDGMPMEMPAAAPLALPTAAVASVAPAAEGKLKAEQDAPQNEDPPAKAKPDAMPTETPAAAPPLPPTAAVASKAPATQAPASGLPAAVVETPVPVLEEGVALAVEAGAAPAAPAAAESESPETLDEEIVGE